MAWFGITEFDPNAFEKIVALLPRLAQIGVYPQPNNLIELLSAIKFDWAKFRIEALKASNAFVNNNPRAEFRSYTAKANDEFQGGRAEFKATRSRVQEMRRRKSEGFHDIFLWAANHFREAG